MSSHIKREPTIEGVILKKLRVIPDERGRLMEILRSDDEFFNRFGQVYMTTAYPGVVKAWHYHKRQTDHVCVLRGMAKVVLYDMRPNSPTNGHINEFFLGEHKRLLVRIPPMVAHGFKCIGTEEIIVVNIPDELYNYKKPDEFRIDPHSGDIPYNWARKDG